MVDFKSIEEAAVSELRKVIAEAQAHEPAVEQAVAIALDAAGAPPSISSGVAQVLGDLLSHFRAHQAASQAPVEAAPVVEPPLAPLPEASASPAVAESQPAAADASVGWTQAVAGSPS